MKNDKQRDEFCRLYKDSPYLLQDLPFYVSEVWHGYQAAQASLLAQLSEPRMVEAVARALVKHHYHSNGLESLVPYTEDTYADYASKEWHKEAKAAIKAITKQLGEI